MDEKKLPPNSYFIEVTGAGIPEVDGLFVPSTESPKESESGTLSSIGYWNGKLAWDRADGKCDRNPSLSYSNSYKSWRIARLDGHLAYHIDCDDDLPPTDEPWNVYKMGTPPAPSIQIFHCDPRQPCPPANIVFVLGGPGAGKGTMCELAKLQLDWVHLSIGELCRDAMKAGGKNAAAIEKRLADGQLVSDDIVVDLVKEQMEWTTRTTGKTNFLLDGFPRSLANLDEWNKVFGSDSPLPKMIYFECPYDVLESRIMGRAKYSGRNDDNIESLKLRFDTFKVETLPTVDFFRGKDKCIEIDTSRDRQAVYNDMAAHLAEFTSSEAAAKPLSERAEVLLGLKPYPKKEA